MMPIKAKAFSLLAKRSYFTKELKQKLSEKGYSQTEIENLIQELTKQGWLNDQDLALRYSEKLRARGYGARVIAQKIYQKAGELDLPLEEDSKEAVLHLIHKKYRNNLPKKRNKVIAALMRRGFSYELIKTLLESIEK